WGGSAPSHDRLQGDPVAALDARGGGADVFQDAAVAFDAAARPGVVVVARDEDAVQAECSGLGEYGPERPRCQAAPPAGRPDAVADVPADVEQEGVQVVPEVDRSQVVGALDDPPVGGVDALLAHGDRPVRLLVQACDPLRKDAGAVEG